MYMLSKSSLVSHSLKLCFKDFLDIYIKNEMCCTENIDQFPVGVQ